MHPLLRGPARLGGYLLLWALFATVPASTLALATPLAMGAAAAVMVPVTVLFGIATLPLWFVCLALPLHLQFMPPTRLLAAQAVVAGLWLGLIALAIGLLLLLGGPHVIVVPWGALATVGLLFYGLGLAFHYLLRSTDSMRIAQEKHAALVLAHRESALAALKAQVHPHFLFNSLNAISALVTQQPHKARDLCVNLADFLR